ncbi:MAG: hypothetical protein WBY47_06755, partial [Desulfobacterales bacterium]
VGSRHYFRRIEAISKLGFSVEIKAGPRINPPRLMTGSSTGILKYVEDLRRGLNADTCPPPADRTKRLF